MTHINTIINLQFQLYIKGEIKIQTISLGDFRQLIDALSFQIRRTNQGNSNTS